MKFKFLVVKNFSQNFLFFLTFLLILIIVCIIKTSISRRSLASLPVSNYNSNTLSIETPNISSHISNEIKSTSPIASKKEIIVKSNLPTDFKGYGISGLLEIPKIALNTYVLDVYSEDALNTSVVKLTGPDPNQIGNFCIVGHNYIKDNMFSKLKKLEIGDRVFLTDNLNRKIEYEVYSIDKVASKDLNCLTQETDNNKEVTLITCTTGALKRLIIKCSEIIYE